MQPTTLVGDLTEPIRQWLPGQRWFAAKRKGAAVVEVRHAATIIDGDPGLVQALVSVDGEAYHLLLGVRSELVDHIGHAVIGQVHGVHVYDAPHDAELMGQLLELLAGNADRGGLRFRHEPWTTLERGLRARPIGAEQSNTSVIYGQNYILKLFRRPSPGPNRDVELHRALHDAGSTHIAEPLGTIEGEGTTFGFLQQFLPDAVEGWATATASVRDLLAEADLHADEVGGDFAGEANRLGVAVAEVHADLAATLGTEIVQPEDIGNRVEAMHGRLDAVLAEVPELREHEGLLRAAFDAVRGLDTPVEVQHVHGDLHLGQVLRSTAGWVLIDFEGEPDADVEHRRALRSPLRDIAGMLRSFEYAAFHLLAGGEDDRQLLARAAEWADRNQAAFCEGYAKVAFDPRSQPLLLRALELDKAVYEVALEHHYRPDWLAIPLATFRRRPSWLT
ncbi:MAG TPA: aminoglycoside phosphotransferase [Actinophytocola sp.]|uniref:maltokinase N-terminal cap-like domain-containing protein n=1 Tax=Actinophytocola sp. TaxID=1872138 RepID=UPI002DDCBA31|nr:aminoglycoside phosphotransferase [Actinophytocola sp.]HEV2782092.1 aminoglycoside phosphotransferase [Actinophytocola sp.]